MAGHGQVITRPDGSYAEIIEHSLRSSIADWLGNTALLYGALQARIPQRILSSSDGVAMQAAKTAAIFEAIVVLKQALARAGIQLPSSMYGGGSSMY